MGEADMVNNTDEINFVSKTSKIFQVGATKYEVESFTTPGVFYVVDVEKLTCSHPFWKKGYLCKHLSYLIGYLTGEGEQMSNKNKRRISRNLLMGFKSFIVSAMHKEVRRGDLKEVLRWGSLLERTRGKEGVKNYLEGIIFEETCNYSLYRKVIDEWDVITWEEIAKLVVASVKKWEVSVIYKPLLLSGDNLKVGFKPILDAVGNKKELMEHAYGIWGVCAETKKIGALVSAIKDSHKLDYDLSGDNVYQVFYLLDVVNGLPIKKANSFNKRMLSKKLRKPNVVTLSFDDFPLYTFDVHTYVGVSRIIKGWDVLRECKMPEYLDLRWSGAEMGCCWRAFAWEQLGKKMYSAKWEDVEIPPKYWRMAMKMDLLTSKQLWKNRSELKWRDL